MSIPFLSFFRDYWSDDHYRRQKRRVITVADLTQIRSRRIHALALHILPPNRPSPTAPRTEIEFSPEYSRENDGTASSTSIPGKFNKLCTI